MAAMVTWRPMAERTDAAHPSTRSGCPEPVEAHKAAAPQSVRCFVLTVSDTRTESTDTSGRAIADLLAAAGHVVTGRAIVKDEADLVRSTIVRQFANADVQAIITTGGT